MTVLKQLQDIRTRCANATPYIREGNIREAYVQLDALDEAAEKAIALERSRGRTQLRLKMSKGNTLMLGVTHTMGTTASVYGIHFPEFDRHQWSPDNLSTDDDWEDDWVMIEINPDGVVTVQGHGAGYAGEIAKDIEVE